MAYQPEKVVATPEMCLSCHDGSVADSRARVFNDRHEHKTNQPPPSNMKIPEIFPLDKDNNMQCATCHTAHGVPSGTAVEETIFMRTSNRNSAMCRGCHPDMDGGINAGNHPVDTTEKEIPSTLMALGAVGGAKNNQVICETCHTAHGSPYDSLLIKSTENSDFCLDCHRDKNIFTPEGKKNPSHIIDARPSKVKIPEILMQSGAKLGKNGIITCQTCHKVHTNKIEKQLLVIPKDNQSGLCLTCHVDKKAIAGTKHNLMRSSPAEKNLEGKTVAEAGVCSACHLPHKPARQLSGDKDFTSQICLSCHAKGKIAENENLTGNTHPLDVSPSKSKNADVASSSINIGKENFTLPLFNELGLQDKNGKMTCSTCHDTHGGATDSTGAEAGKEAGEQIAATLFLRSRSPDICRGCHQEKFDIANSKHDLAKMVPAEKNIRQQTPSESGLCGTCHLVHNAQKYYLWARNLAPSAETGAADLCLGCHNENGVAGKKTIQDYSHPVNIPLPKKGMTTTLPLFDPKTNTAEDGVMTCHTCHDPHRWNPLKALPDDHFNMEGNSQNSFLRLENSPSPKLCGNCHAEQATIEKTDHDLMTTAPASKNDLDQTPAESGTCGVCHIVHNSKNKFKLWAQNFGPGDSIMETLCNSCHSASGWARNKTPLISSHPEEKMVDLGEILKDRYASFPLFNKTSGKLVTHGNISCPSCHNAHQWDPGSATKGPGVNVEGNATNSFLRAQSFNMICKDCHGIEGLFRFKFFHDPDERKPKGTMTPN